MQYALKRNAKTEVDSTPKDDQHENREKAGKVTPDSQHRGRATCAGEDIPAAL